MITYNQYQQLYVRQRLVSLTCLPWRDSLRKEDLSLVMQSGLMMSLPGFGKEHGHLGPPLSVLLSDPVFSYCIIHDAVYPSVALSCSSSMCMFSLYPSCYITYTAIFVYFWIL